MATCPQIHVPPLEKHLQLFGYMEFPFECEFLVAVTDFANDQMFLEEQYPEILDRLKKRHSSGIEENKLLTFDFEGAGMGGCGASCASVLFCPEAMVEIVCEWDHANWIGEVVASAEANYDQCSSREYASIVIDHMDWRVLQNGAMSALINHNPQEINPRWLRSEWEMLATKHGCDVDLSMKTFDELYTEREY